MRQRPDVSKIITYGYMNVSFLKDTVQGQFSEREDICLWLMPANFMSNRKS